MKQFTEMIFLLSFLTLIFIKPLTDIYKSLEGKALGIFVLDFNTFYLKAPLIEFL